MIKIYIIWYLLPTPHMILPNEHINATGFRDKYEHGWMKMNTDGCNDAMIFFLSM